MTTPGFRILMTRLLGLGRRRPYERQADERDSATRPAELERRRGRSDSKAESEETTGDIGAADRPRV